MTPLYQAKKSFDPPLEMTTLLTYVCNKKSRFDLADELRVGDVRYKHLT